ncbi:hypothetical protein BvCmsJ76A_04053 [Escherichia coli]|nr:hypothetical protein BvCmsJ76A_04053 [Escherichia coli]
MSRANTSVIQRRKGAISTEPGNRIAGAFTPAAVSYCLHCKNAANCDHMMLSLNSHGDLCIIQTIIKIVMHKMLTMIVFCGIALDSFYREALTFHLSGRKCQGLGLNKCLTRGLSTSGLQVILPAVSRKAPARNLPFTSVTCNG